ncbi:hypothetical protein ACFLW2_05185 [Chloroflexota bacterium]
MKQALIGVISFTVAAFILVLLGYTTDSPDMRYAILAGSVGLLGAGLSLNCFILAQRTDSRIDEINTTLSRLESLQKEIHSEQREQAKSDSPLATSLQALSQYYVDYIDKQIEQKSADEQ